MPIYQPPAPRLLPDDELWAGLARSDARAEAGMLVAQTTEFRFDVEACGDSVLASMAGAAFQLAEQTTVIEGSVADELVFTLLGRLRSGPAHASGEQRRWWRAVLDLVVHTFADRADRVRYRSASGEHPTAVTADGGPSPEGRLSRWYVPIADTSRERCYEPDELPVRGRMQLRLAAMLDGMAFTPAAGDKIAPGSAWTAEDDRRVWDEWTATVAEFGPHPWGPGWVGLVWGPVWVERLGGTTRGVPSGVLGGRHGFDPAGVRSADLARRFRLDGVDLARVPVADIELVTRPGIIAAYGAVERLTGWRPAPMQAAVYLPALSRKAGLSLPAVLRR